HLRLGHHRARNKIANQSPVNRIDDVVEWGALREVADNGHPLEVGAQGFFDVSNPAAGFGIPDRLGSEADGTGRGQLGTEAFRQQVLPEAQNALAELLQALQFGRGFAALGTPPAWQGGLRRRSWDHHCGMCHNCTFLLVVNETLRTLEGKDREVTAPRLGSKYYNYFRYNFKS